MCKGNYCGTMQPDSRNPTQSSCPEASREEQTTKQTMLTITEANNPSRVVIQAQHDLRIRKLPRKSLHFGSGSKWVDSPDRGIGASCARSMTGDAAPQCPCQMTRVGVCPLYFVHVKAPPTRDAQDTVSIFLVKPMLEVACL